MIVTTLVYQLIIMANIINLVSAKSSKNMKNYTKMIGGKTTDIHKFPFMVSLHHNIFLIDFKLIYSNRS